MGSNLVFMLEMEKTLLQQGSTAPIFRGSSYSMQ